MKSSRRDEGPVERSRMFFKRQSAEDFREKIIGKHPEAHIQAVPTSYAKRSHARYRVVWRSARDPGMMGEIREGIPGHPGFVIAYLRGSHGIEYNVHRRGSPHKWYASGTAHSIREVKRAAKEGLEYTLSRGERDQRQRRMNIDSRITEVRELRERVAVDMRPLFDHLLNLAKHSHEVGYPQRAGRELRQARLMATKYPARDPERRHRHRTPGAPSFAKQKLISKKIRLLIHEGYPPKQAAAIAYRMYGASRKA